MSWNYRVMRRHDVDGYVFAIHEVFYDDAGKPDSWTAEPSWPQGETFRELTEDIANYQRAFQRPVLAIEANESELYEIGPMGTNDAKRTLVWKKADAPEKG